VFVVCGGFYIIQSAGVKDMTEDRIEQWNERAAILAESMQLSREASEDQAALQMGMTDSELEEARSASG
jgi:hypothetical protein